MSGACLVRLPKSSRKSSISFLLKSNQVPRMRVCRSFEVMLYFSRTDRIVSLFALRPELDFDSSLLELLMKSIGMLDPLLQSQKLQM